MKAPTESKRVSDLLSALSDLVRRSSADELEALARGEASLTIVRSKKEAGGQRLQSQDSASSKEKLSTTELISELSRLNSRSAGERYLNEAKLTKNELTALARVLDLPIRKEDKADHLRQRIVDVTIGARLNSLAIRGN